MTAKIEINDKKISIESDSIQDFEWGDVFIGFAYLQEKKGQRIRCIEFQKQDGESIKLDETMDGWNELYDHLENYIPDVLPNWRKELAVLNDSVFEVILYSKVSLDPNDDEAYLYQSDKGIKLDAKQISIDEVYMLWEEVYTINGTKVDYGHGEPLLHLVFDYDFGEFLEFYSDQKGWDILIRDLDKYLPIQPSNWRELLGNADPNEEMLEFYRRKE